MEAMKHVKLNPTYFLRPTALVLPLVLWLTGCGQAPQPVAEPDRPAPQISGKTITFTKDAPELNFIGTTPAKARTLAVTHATGRLYWDGDRTVGVFTPVAGRVTAILADVGQNVTQGTPLAELDSPDFAQALANARTAVAALAAAEKANTREQELLAHGAAAQKDVEAAQAAYVAALAERDRAEQVLANYGGHDTDTTDRYELCSPIAGMLVDKNINLGQELRADLMLANAPNFFSPVFTISDPSKLWLNIDVSETDLTLVQKGERVRVTTHAFPDRVFAGVVDQIAPTMDPNTRTVKVRGVVDNPDGALKAEMYVQADIEQIAAQAGTLGVEVPAKALFMKGNDSFLFVATAPGVFERRQVKVGIEKDDVVPVFTGLAAGDVVVTEGALLLQSVLEPAN